MLHIYWQNIVTVIIALIKVVIIVLFKVIGTPSYMIFSAGLQRQITFVISYLQPLTKKPFQNGIYSLGRQNFLVGKQILLFKS